MTEKSKFYDVSEVLKHEQDGTTYVLHKAERQGILARQYEDRAAAIYEEAQESFFADNETRYAASLVYRSKMIELESWRIAQIGQIINYIKECMQDRKHVDGEERQEIKRTLHALHEELDALIRVK